VLNALLDITRLDLGVVDVKVIDFVVADLLDHVASTFAPMARDHRLALRVRPSRAIARSDPVLLERILFNFVSNAVRYSTRGGVLVGCRRRQTCLSCEVWDTGPGIAQGSLQSIFEEFNQLAPEGAQRSLGALGLGLSIAQRTAALLGHPIQVTSCLGKGSCFRVDIPWGTQPPHALAAPPADATASVLVGAFVVVVEDEREQREGEPWHGWAAEVGIVPGGSVACWLRLV
jgi:signal transduction histidine kinase